MRFFAVLSFAPFVLLVLVPAIILLLWFPIVVDTIRGYVLMYDGFWYLGIIGFYILWWVCAKRKEKASSGDPPPLDERKLGAEALRSQVTSGIVASSFLVAAAAFLFGKPFGAETIGLESALMDIQRAVAWLIVALLIGLWNVFSIAGRVNQLNVATQPYYNILAVGQLFAILFGVLNFASGMSWVIGQ